MAATEDAVAPAVTAEELPPTSQEEGKVTEEGKTAEEKAPVGKTAKEKKAKVPKEKKPHGPSHPTYLQMIKEAILASKEKSGLSPYAISKYMDEKYKAVLPANYKKTLTVQLRNCVAKGQLVKVKGSFKLSETGKKKKTVSTTAAAPKKKASAVKRKEKKPKSSAPAEARQGEEGNGTKKRKKPIESAKPKSAKKVKKVVPAKAKQPKSIKSPAAKRAKKAP